MTITITIPVFNVADYLDCCVESIVNQTYRDIEIILVDDGSNDGSQDLCDRWAVRDGRIKVIHQDNQGLYMARKAGAKNATGDYVLSVDADDWLEEETCEEIADAIRQSSADIIQYGLQVECASKDDPNVLSNEKWFNVSTNELNGSDEMLVRCYVERKIPWNIATKAIRTSILNKAYNFLGDYRINQLEDFLTAYGVFLNSRKWKRVDGKFYHYRYGTGMSTTGHMSLSELNKKSGYHDAFEALKSQVRLMAAPESIAYQVVMNEMDAYIREERSAQMKRNRLYPQYSIGVRNKIKIYNAVLPTATNFNYSINKKIAVHLFVCDHSQLSKYRQSFESIPVLFDLYISLPETNKLAEDVIMQQLSGLANARQIIVKRVPNADDDTLPLFKTFRNEIIEHQIILHLQIKNSCDSIIESITDHLLNENYTKTLLLMLSEDAGLIVPPEHLYYSWTGNIQNHFFWTRTECLEPLLNRLSFTKNSFGKKGFFMKALRKAYFHQNLNSVLRIYQVFLSEEEVRDAKSKKRMLTGLKVTLLIIALAVFCCLLTFLTK